MDQVNTNSLLLVLIRKIYLTLPSSRKLSLIFVFLIMLLSGLVEVFNLATLIPFLTLLSEPDRISEIDLFYKFAQFLNVTDRNGLLYLFTSLFVIVIIFSSFLRIFTIWLCTRYSALIGSDLSCQYYKKVLSRPYIVHLQRNSSELLASATTYVEGTQIFLFAFLQIITSIVIATSLLFSLIYINWFIASLSFLFFGIVYLLIAKLVKKRLDLNGKIIVKLSDLQLKKIQEGIGSIKEVLIHNLQNTFSRIYKKADLPLRLKKGEGLFISGFPKYLIEAIGLVLISLFALILSLNADNKFSLLAILGALALAAQRLLPALQNIYNGWANMIAYTSSVKIILKEIETNQSLEVSEKTLNGNFTFNNSIEIKNVSFSYPGSKKIILDEINLTLKKGEFIGIFGESGGGKSTLLNILLGLLKPNKGSLLIDNNSLYDKANLQNWRSFISYIPQNIYLCDSSFLENIAFGESFDEIDIKRVRESVKNALLDELIDNSLNGYSTNLGERGIRISGGQLQRIGIARAFYRNSEVLFFDEATSALDLKTEALIMKKINKLKGFKTAFIVAHRLETLKNCDRIIEISKGRIIREYENKEFKKLVLNK